MSTIPLPPETTADNFDTAENKIRHCFWYAVYEEDFKSAETVVEGIQAIFLDLLRGNKNQEETNTALDAYISANIPGTIKNTELLDEITVAVTAIKNHSSQ
jgi:hypothetical protein